ncbi:hypothetical protein [Actinoplanes sp. RD1]|uniref:hypothetical protein n=1 Tax=Actinoplanes sp. RD1 TaxID=3064538 RepID=UPI002740B846|nr:hypothetical protein [Actinoplanes sp. RD1]
MTRKDVEAAGGSWAAPSGHIDRIMGVEGVPYEDDRCTLGPQVQIEVLTTRTSADASIMFESVVRNANEGVAPLQTPSLIPGLGDQARQLPGWVIVLRGTRVLTVTSL